MPAFFRNCLILTVTISFLAPLAEVHGRDDTEPKPLFSAGTKPFVVLTAASANRLKEEAAFLFETAEMPDAVDAVLEKLDENVGGLQGLNWDRPAGVMVFLNSVIPPSFEFVSFLPVSTEEEFCAMMELGSGVMREEPTEAGRYELIAPRGNVQIRMQGDYAFVQLPMMGPDPLFDRDLPDPAAFAAPLARQYDLALSMDVEAVPKATRDLLLNMLSTMMSTQHQQRDDEPDAVYAVRDAWQQRDIAAIKLFFEDTQRITLGLNLDRDTRGADLDMVIDARAASKMLEEIFLSSTKPSYFTPLISDETPVSVSYSAVTAERDRDAAADTVEAAKGWVAMKIEELGLGPVPDESSPLFHGLTAVRKTVQQGHLDMFAQFYQDSDDRLAVVAAIRVEDGEAVASGLQDLLMRIQGLEEIGDVEIGANEHAGISFHRIDFRNPDAGAIELFGANPGISFGSGSRTAWACVGGDASFETLTGLMDQLEAAYENPVEREVPASLRVVVNFTQLKGLIDGAEKAKRASASTGVDELSGFASKEGSPGKPGVDVPKPAGGKDGGDQFRPENRGQQRRSRQAANNKVILETLAEGEDRIQMDFRPTDKGMRFRTHFDLGFVRAFGRVFGSRFTEN